MKMDTEKMRVTTVPRSNGAPGMVDVFCNGKNVGFIDAHEMPPKFFLRSLSDAHTIQCVYPLPGQSGELYRILSEAVKAGLLLEEGEEIDATV